jgi:hypothetical protein
MTKWAYEETGWEPGDVVDHQRCLWHHRFLVGWFEHPGKHGIGSTVSIASFGFCRIAVGHASFGPGTTSLSTSGLDTTTVNRFSRIVCVSGRRNMVNLNEFVWQSAMPRLRRGASKASTKCLGVTRAKPSDTKGRLAKPDVTIRRLFLCQTTNEATPPVPRTTPETRTVRGRGDVSRRRCSQQNHTVSKAGR